MEHAALLPLSAWESFYVIIGSAAAALTGLQFVVIVLSTEIKVLGSDTTTGAFSTPTIVHFCAVLLISAILSAPWSAFSSIGFVLGVGGLLGFGYAVIVVRQMRRQTEYVPVLEDWIWHATLPLIAYAALLAAAIFLPRDATSALFMVAGIALLLLFIGIHNAWDSAVYVALRRRQQQLEERGEQE